MEGHKELQSKKFQELLSEIGQEIQPHDIEIFKNQLRLKERLPSSVLDDIDSRGRNSGLYFLYKLQEEGHLAEDNLELLKELFQANGRHDLLMKLFEFEEKIKEYEKTSSEIEGAIARETVAPGRRPTTTLGFSSYGTSSPGSSFPDSTPSTFGSVFRSYKRRSGRGLPSTPPSASSPASSSSSLSSMDYFDSVPLLFSCGLPSTPPSASSPASSSTSASYEELHDIFRFEEFESISDSTPSIFPSASQAVRKSGASLLSGTSESDDYEGVRESEKLEQFFYGTILHTEHVKINVEGGFHDLSSLGVLLQIPPNAVTGPTDIKCVTFSPVFHSPTEENETLVSYCVRIYSISAPRLQKPIIVTLKHSGPNKKEGYETIVKAWEEPRRENHWKQMKEMQEDTLLAREHFESGFIEVGISEWTSLAVVTRLITDTFEVTDKGCVVRSSVCDDVTVEFPEGAVDKTYTGSMKLLMMPDHIDIVDDIAAYPCPLLLIDGFEGVSFKIPVKIRLPHPHPAGCPSGNVRLLTMDTPHEWNDITDEVVYIVEDESFIELQVSHFSVLFVWIYKVPLAVVSWLSQYLLKPPQDVCFAVFKEAEVCSNKSLTMSLVCVPNHEQFKITDAMKKEGFKKLASSTGNKKMRPDDKAYTKVEGCYEKKLKEDIFLQFIKNGICRKELPLRRKRKKRLKDVNSSRELVISLLEQKDGDANDNLCKFCIEETRIVPKLMKKERSVKSYQVQEVETLGLESAPLCSSKIVYRPSTRTSTSEAASCKDLEVCFGDTSIATIDSKEAASKVADLLKLDKLSLDDPPDDIVVKCRELCSYLKSNRRRDIVEKIRDLLPSGMTGPLGDGNLLVKDMDNKTKEQISWALMAAGDQWKVFAENVGVSKDKIRFYDKRVENPVLSILDDHCGNMTVEELYVHIVESGANAIADNHL